METRNRNFVGKNKVARATGIPTTQQNRRRKAGAAMGFMIPLVCMLGIFFLCSCGKKQVPDFGIMQQKVLESRLTYKNKTSDYSDKIREIKEKLSEIEENFKDDQESLKSIVETYQTLLETYQAAEEANTKIADESSEQMKKAAFLMVHIQYAALKDSAAKKDFMKMINDSDLFSGTGTQSIIIMRYPDFAKEAETKEYSQRLNQLTKDLHLKMQVGILTYDNIEDLENAYEVVKKLY